MDLGLYLKVIKRHKVISGLGLLLSVLAAAYMTVTFDGGLKRKGSATYEGVSTMLITQQGSPEFRSTLDEFVPGKGSPDAVPRFSDPLRFQYLANLYASIISGDEVRSRVRTNLGLPKIPPKDEPPLLDPDYTVTPGRALDGTPLPTLVIAGRGTSDEMATRITNDVARVARQVVAQKQREAAIPESYRIAVVILDRADRAKIVKPNYPTKGIMLFLVGLMLTVGAAFVAENITRGPKQPGEDATGATATDEGEPVAPIHIEPSARPATRKTARPRARAAETAAPPEEAVAPKARASSAAWRRP
ncbi:MAG: hypothetical protein ACKVUT_12520 [Gaiella sp.]